MRRNRGEYERLTPLISRGSKIPRPRPLIHRPHQFTRAPVYTRVHCARSPNATRNRAPTMNATKPPSKKRKRPRPAAGSAEAPAAAAAPIANPAAATSSSSTGFASLGLSDWIVQQLEKPKSSGGLGLKAPTRVQRVLDKSMLPWLMPQSSQTPSCGAVKQLSEPTALTPSRFYTGAPPSPPPSAAAMFSCAPRRAAARRSPSSFPSRTSSPRRLRALNAPMGSAPWSSARLASSASRSAMC